MNASVFARRFALKSSAKEGSKGSRPSAAACAFSASESRPRSLSMAFHASPFLDGNHPSSSETKSGAFSAATSGAHTHALNASAKSSFGESLK